MDYLGSFSIKMYIDMCFSESNLLLWCFEFLWEEYETDVDNIW